MNIFEELKNKLDFIRQEQADPDGDIIEIDNAIDALFVMIDRLLDRPVIETSHAEFNAITDCLDYAADQIITSNGDVEVFYRDCADTTPEEQLQMLDTVKDLRDRFKNEYKEGSVNLLINVNDGE